MNNSNLISIDLAKNVFQVCVLNKHNKVVSNKKVSRAKLFETVVTIDDASNIVMEACYSSNYWARFFQQQGYHVGLIPPHQVKPFVVGNKNDHNDALAIAEASKRPKVTFVAVKTIDQQDLQSLSRIRDRLVKARTALANQLRGLLAEYGVIIPKSLKALRENIPIALDDDSNQLTTISRGFVNDLYLELLEFDEKIKLNEKQFITLLAGNGDYKLLQTIPGIGPVIAASLICAVHDAKQFKNGRQMAAWSGLTPKQHASGDVSRMGGISKRGNQSLRRQVIHGARAVVRWCEEKDDALSLWLKNLLKTKHKNKVVVALANKIVRMAWAILYKKEAYNPAILAEVALR